MNVDNVKSHKKAMFQHLSRKHIFRKTAGGKIDSPRLLRVKIFKFLFWLFGHVEKRLDWKASRLITKLMTPQTGEQIQ